MAGTLMLKWGTVKGWDSLDEAAMAALHKFGDLGMSYSAAAQQMTPEHVEALCEVIDAVDEPIINDWSGDRMTRDQAKEYVRTYRR